MNEQQSLGLVGSCSRCGVPLRVGGGPDPKARLLRLSATPEGYCLECAVTEWMFLTPPICFLFGKGDAVDPREAEYCRKQGWDKELDGPDSPKRGPQVLLLPHVRESVRRLFVAGHAQASEAAINWNKVIENWELPFADHDKAAKRRKRRKRGPQ